MSESTSCTVLPMAATTGSSAPATSSPEHLLHARRAAGGVEADRLRPAFGPAGQAELGLELARRPLAEDQAKARSAPRSRSPRPSRCPPSAGSPRARPASRPRPRPRSSRRPTSTTNPPAPGAQVEAGARGGRDRLVDELHRRSGAAGRRARRRPTAAPPRWRRPARRPARAAERPVARAGLAQEAVQHLRRRVQVGDHAVAQRVETLMSSALCPREHIGGGADGGHRPSGRIDSDRGRFLEHEPAALDPDERVDRAQVDRHAAPDAHPCSPLVPSRRTTPQLRRDTSMPGQSDPSHCDQECPVVHLGN